MNKKKQIKRLKRISAILGAAFLVSFILAIFSVYYGISRIKTVPISTIALAKEAEQEIGCPCCDKNIFECTCGMAAQMRRQVSDLTETLFEDNPYLLSKEKILFASAKEFGLETIENDVLRARLRQKIIGEAPAIRPKISISPAEKDLGNISLNEGVKETFFDIKNEGDSNLIISGGTTSCGCTTAQIIFRVDKSPVFGMHSPPSNWKIVIPAGDKGKLKVMYNPNVHKDFRGEAVRTISVKSNDPIDGKKEVKIYFKQIE